MMLFHLPVLSFYKEFRSTMIPCELDAFSYTLKVFGS